MTKSDITYASIPSTAASEASGPYVQGFAVGESTEVTVIVDQNENKQQQQQHRNNNNNSKYNPYYGDHPSETLMSGSLGRRPVNLSECPLCHQMNARTFTRTYPAAGTWAGVVATAICCFPLAWVPLVVDTCKQTDHYCQSCNGKVATVKPLEGCFVKEQR